MGVYTFIDVSRKQEFIYRHNRLRDNLLNSYIIKAVTEDIRIMAGDGSEEVNRTNQLPVSLNGYLEANFQGGYVFEFSGGGNSIIQFYEGEDTAQIFARGFSAAVLEAYPELELYISIVNATERGIDKFTNEMGIRNCLIGKADELKDKRRAVFRRWTYGIEVLDETGKASLIE